tara:strand:- start:9183 stop:9779 length:597 start_codon:yes stop_codon:yes gene_type:complete
MIEFINLSGEEPYALFKKNYHKAKNAGQKNIEAIVISSFNKEIKEVDSRFVNIKIIDNQKFIFFSNYNSPKAIAFNSFDQISALFYWSSINTQIRMKAIINKTTKNFNNEYFEKRNKEKNALAISSDQSKSSTSYNEIVSKYENIKKTKNLLKCPDYWGGFSFIPYYFEFWEGHKSRVNKRLIFDKTDLDWKRSFLEP